MSNEGGLGALVAEIRQASENISAGDARMNQRLDGIEHSVNELYKKHGRPGASWESKDEDVAERKSAIDLCCNRRALTVPKIDAGVPDNYTPTPTEIDEALVHRKAIKALMRTGDPARIDHTFQKSLSSFSFASTGYLLPPEMSNRVLSCIVEPTDLSGLVDRINIGAPSIRFPIDNARMPLAAWACESGCFANNPSPDLAEGLGQLEIKAESLRFVVCATSDLLADASMNVEAWILNKVSEGFRATINYSILLGDGVGKPLGMLTPQAGIPICDTSASTPVGQFSWQDLVQLKYEIPMQWQDGCYFLMNQRTFALLQTMSSAEGRPLWGAQGTNSPGTGFSFAGSPIMIASQMPDVAAGSTPILFGNLKRTYVVVDRKATTMHRWTTTPRVGAPCLSLRPVAAAEFCVLTQAGYFASASGVPMDSIPPSTPGGTGSGSGCVVLIVGRAKGSLCIATAFSLSSPALITAISASI